MLFGGLSKRNMQTLLKFPLRSTAQCKRTPKPNMKPAALLFKVWRHPLRQLLRCGPLDSLIDVWQTTQVADVEVTKTLRVVKEKPYLSFPPPHTHYNPDNPVWFKFYISGFRRHLLLQSLLWYIVPRALRAGLWSAVQGPRIPASPV